MMRRDGVCETGDLCAQSKGDGSVTVTVAFYHRRNGHEGHV